MARHTVAALTAAAVLAGCGGSEGTVTEPEEATRPQESASSTGTTGATESTTGATTTSGGGAGETTPGLGDLSSGTHYGLLTDLSQGVVDGEAVQVISVDKVDFLQGEEAVEAAREAGVIGPDEDAVPNDYFTRNDNPLIRDLPVEPGADVSVLVGGSPELVPGTLEEAVAAGTLFTIEVVQRGDVSLVTAVEGFYLP